MKWHVGLKYPLRQPFKAEALPTQTSHPQFNAVIGPFRTKRGAEFMAANTHVHTVQDAEHAAKVA